MTITIKNKCVTKLLMNIEINVEDNNGFKMYYYDKQWQKPVITEYQIFKLFKDQQNIPSNYFAFPWATMVDNVGNKRKNPMFTFLSNYKINVKNCFTVMQHINFRNYLLLVKNIGIKYVFTPHKAIGDEKYENEYGIVLIPFSLFPAQFKNLENIRNLNKKYLTSFIGQYEDYYLTIIRKRIFEIFNNYTDCKIIKRNEWHYRGMVYFNKLTSDSEKEEEYSIILTESIFSLCPSGSGPNSIRIWESMSCGSIPVILADTLILPNIENIDWNDYFVLWKENEIDKLYEYLKNINADKIQKMANNCVDLYNKYFCPENMNKIILNYFDSYSY